MKTLKKWLLCGMSIGMVLCSGPSAGSATIAPDLKETLASFGSGSGEELPVIVTLKDRVDLAALRGRPRAELLRALKKKAKSTLGPLQSYLRQRGTKRLQELWAINGVAVTAGADLIREMANLPGVESVRIDALLNAPETTLSSATAPEWNMASIRAPELWALGYSGAGVVAASMDTGVDAGHPDLAGRWRGGTNSWFDPNQEHDTPYDRVGHGTQVMGLLVGGHAGGTAIGVAPGATWIAVKVFNDAGQARLSGIHLGFQWLLDPDGDVATDDAPHVVNNSWGFSHLTNQCYLEFEPDIQILKAAGIAVVFAAGNQGPWAQTSVSPANNPSGFGVGAVDVRDVVGDFSGRGPAACEGRIYPDVTAPGQSVRTTDLTLGGAIPDSYVMVSGTSFAAPHVAGAMALLIEAFPSLTVAVLEAALRASARDLGSAGPDNDYGHGLIDLVNAYTTLSTLPACTDADGDGYYASAGCGSPRDCNDGHDGVHPGAVEIKHDGFDQDCNGYDLTIDIRSASYNLKKRSLFVEAASALEKDAALVVAGYGPLKWNASSGTWKATFNRTIDPGTVTVSGFEGAETAQTTLISR